MKLIQNQEKGNVFIADSTYLSINYSKGELGNFIPSWLYHLILLNKKPDLVSIVILSELIHLYGASSEKTLPKNYNYLSSKFRISSNEILKACLRLEGANLIKDFKKTIADDSHNSLIELKFKLNIEKLLSLRPSAYFRLTDGNVWAYIQNSLELICHPKVYNDWFSDLKAIVNKGNKGITVIAPSLKIRDRINEVYLEMLKGITPAGFKIEKVIYEGI